MNETDHTPEALVDVLKDARRVLEDTAYKLPFALRAVYLDLIARINTVLEEGKP